MSDNEYDDYDMDDDENVSSDGHITDEDEEDEDREKDKDEEEDDDGVVEEDFNEVEVTTTEVNSNPDNTYPYLTHFEITRLLESMALKLDHGDPSTVKMLPNEKSWQVARRQLEERRCPLNVQRIDVSTGKVLYEINPNHINPVTGEYWYRGNYHINMY